MSMKYRILLVDDEPDILEFVGYNLNRAGYAVYTASNGKDAVSRALEVHPHLILIDVMMPEMDGIEACRIIRAHKELGNPMIAFLTARGEDYSQIAGFEAGADDYITKPVRMQVLLSRIKALFKRLEGQGDNADSTDGDLVVDHERYVVIVNGQEVVMPRKEFGILELLYSKPNKVFSREEIFSSVWGNDVVVGDRTIDVHIRKLREKIGENRIITVKGVGYKYNEPQKQTKQI
jgi:two-component system alkaline phosphatase synthesis response regulator PhoP